jgi:hypothetical protein
VSQRQAVLDAQREVPRLLARLLEAVSRNKKGPGCHDTQTGHPAPCPGSGGPGVSGRTPPDAKTAAVPSEADLLATTGRVLYAMDAKLAREGGAVKIPDLEDAVRAEHPGMTRALFHGLLKKWRDEDRVVLKTINDRSLEPRGDEGILGPRGMHFYIEPTGNMPKGHAPRKESAEGLIHGKGGWRRRLHSLLEEAGWGR